MFFLRKPSTADIEALIVQNRHQPHSYAEVGASREIAPRGYNIDHNRVLLGRGRDAFSRATEGIDDWKMFDLPWIELFPKRPRVERGETVAVVVSHLGFLSVNISRVVYVIQESNRYGFAYGALSAHAEKGEERFIVEYDAQTEEVWYDLFAFSRPRNLLARLGYPFSRHLQRRFARESLAAMRHAVKK